MTPAQDSSAAARARASLASIGLVETGAQHWNEPTVVLVEQAITRGEGKLTDTGAVAFLTGKFTGRSPKDKYIVRDDETVAQVDWGDTNQPFDPDRFESLFKRVCAHFRGREVWIQDAFAGADPALRLPIRVVCERAYHALFARQLFVRPTLAELAAHAPEFTLFVAPDFQADSARDGTRGEVFVILDFTRKIVLIGGTLYAGEIKKAVFTILNYLLPKRGVLSMHCSTNAGAAGDVTLFFGLSGTGKTTLSADLARRLIGDDEHGWSDDGVFNIEGGCYAKCIRLDRLNEPEIYDAIRFGTVLENVVLHPDSRAPDFADASLTENTRAAYPIDYIPNHEPSGRAGHPNHIIFLTCDAFGVLPPLSKLAPEQAMYHFLSGYTAKVAGTERGLGDEPAAVFSACFGAPFLPLPPRVYADLLGEKMRRHGVHAWLLNTGWIGGGFGKGARISLRHTRALVDAVIADLLVDAPFRVDPIFGLSIPKTCPGVPDALLDPREAWTSPAAYDDEATRLARRFHENFRRFPRASAEIRAAGPTAGRDRA
ncbi:MAG: phosphoenolpyruvate carboxykinase (ATP) [Planctomycetota bacterium]|nr:phosphoenolpyruvate carboxykinase (ATP) [Planctomycetota bacterium]